MENRAHTDVKNFLMKKRRFLEDKVEYWMEKYEKDTEAKTNEHTQLKSDKERDLKILQELARTYDDYEVNILLLVRHAHQSVSLFPINEKYYFFYKINFFLRSASGTKKRLVRLHICKSQFFTEKNHTGYKQAKVQIVLPISCV